MAQSSARKRFSLVAKRCCATKSGRQSRRKCNDENNEVDDVHLRDYNHQKQTVCIRVNSENPDFWSEVTLSLKVLESFVKQQQAIVDKEKENYAGFEVSGEMHSSYSTVVRFREQKLILKEELKICCKPIPEFLRLKPGRRFAMRLILSESFPVLISAVITQNAPNSTECAVIWGTSLPIRTQPFAYEECADIFPPENIPPFVFYVWNWHGWIASSVIAITTLNTFLEQCVSTTKQHLALDPRVLSFEHHCDVYKVMMKCTEEEFCVENLQE